MNTLDANVVVVVLQEASIEDEGEFEEGEVDDTTEQQEANY